MKNKALNALKVIGAAIMVIMVLVATLSVIWRTVAQYVDGIDGSSMYWANELQQLLFHWVIVIGTIIAYHNRSQLNITVIYSKFKNVGRKWLDRFFNLATILVFSVVLIWGAMLVSSEINTKTPALELSRGLFVYAPYVALSAYIVIHQLIEFVASFRGGKQKEANA